jgi:hypothetical protein
LQSLYRHSHRQSLPLRQLRLRFSQALRARKVATTETMVLLKAVATAVLLTIH